MSFAVFEYFPVIIVFNINFFVIKDTLHNLAAVFLRYLKFEELRREDPSPSWTVHQGQYAFPTRASVQGSQQVNPVPAVTTVLTQCLQLLQVLSVHYVSACIS